MRRTIEFLCLCLLLLTNISVTGAESYIAFLQFSNPAGWTHMVFQTDIPDEHECMKLNENHWKGAKTGCPQCKQDDIGCLSSLPRSLKGMIDNEPLLLPYLSSERDRIVYIGMPMPDAINMCQTMAKLYIDKAHRPAVCVLPNND